MNTCAEDKKIAENILCLLRDTKAHIDFANILVVENCYDEMCQEVRIAEMTLDKCQEQFGKIDEQSKFLCIKQEIDHYREDISYLYQFLQRLKEKYTAEKSNSTSFTLVCGTLVIVAYVLLVLYSTR